MTKKKPSKPKVEVEKAEDVTDVTQTPTPEDILEGEVVDAPDTDVSIAETDEQPPEVEVEAEPETPEQPSSIAHTETPQKKGGFTPLLLGGAVAGALGFGASAYMEPKSWPFGETNTEIETTLQTQSDQLQTLQDQIAQMQGSFTPVGETADLSTSIGDLNTTLATISQSVTDIDARVAQLETLPAASGDGTDQTSLLAFEAEMQSLRGLVEDQKAALQAAADKAVETQQSAEDALKMEAARAALGVIQIAGDTGQPFEAALNEFQANSDAEIDPVLAEVASTGVPTLAQIQADVADNARSALAVSRSEEVKPESVTGRVSAFFKAQTGARSVAPREGADADAVLSRVEAAVKSGQLNDAVAELETLPEVGRAAMSDWTAQVTTRLQALNAIDALSEALSSN